MNLTTLEHTADQITLQVTIDLKGSLPEREEWIQGVVNAVGSESTAAAIAKFDSDGVRL